MIPIVSLLFSLLVLVLVLWIIKLVIDQLPLPPQIRHIAMLIIGLAGLVAVLQWLGIFTVWRL